MSEAWLNFAIVVFVQFLLFIVSAYYAKRLSDVPRILGWSALIGIVMGLSFDLVLGKFFGLNSYALGFGAPFLIVNGLLSYGLFVGNILLLQKTRLVQFYMYTMGIVVIYEITNHFFRVWTWEFALSPVGFLVVLSTGYFGGALLVAITSHVLLGRRFTLIHDFIR